MLKRLVKLTLIAGAVLSVGCDQAAKTSGTTNSCTMTPLESSDDSSKARLPVQADIPAVPLIRMPGARVELPDRPASHMPTAQIWFKGPEGVRIDHDAVVNEFGYQPLIAPARCNFMQCSVSRLHLSNIKGRDKAEVQATLEVYPVTPRTIGIVEHTAIPIEFTEEDFDQALTGSVITKAYYSPDVTNDGQAKAAVEVVVTNSNDPGEGAVTMADKKGSLFAVVRLAGIDTTITATSRLVSDSNRLQERMKQHPVIDSPVYEAVPSETKASTKPAVK